MNYKELKFLIIGATSGATLAIFVFLIFFSTGHKIVESDNLIARIPIGENIAIAKTQEAAPVVKTTYPTPKPPSGKVAGATNSDNVDPSLGIFTLGNDSEQKTSTKEKSEAPETKCSYQDDSSPAKNPDIIFNEVNWMGSQENSNAEWLEIKNISSKTLTLSGWEIIDLKEQIKYIFPNGLELPQNSLYLIKRGESTLKNISAPIYTGALSNTDEGIKLFNNDCSLVDLVEADPKWPAGDSKNRLSMERGGDLTWHTCTAKSGSTPAERNSNPPEPLDDEQSLSSTDPAEQDLANPDPEPASPDPNEGAGETTPTSTPEVIPEPEQQTQEVVDSDPVQITEVMAGTASSTNDEFIELYNPNDQAIDLTGYAIKKKTSSGSESSFVASSRFEGLTIPAGKHFLIVHDGSYTGSVSADLTWPTSYSLAYSNNSVILYNSEGKNISEVSWTEDIQDQSYVCDSRSCSVSSPDPQNSSN